MTKRQRIIAGLGEQNEASFFNDEPGFWVQPDCVFIRAADLGSMPTPAQAVQEYRRRLSVAKIGISHNHHCDGIRYIKTQQQTAER